MNRLYIVSTPIGNLQDITLRASKILLSSKVIVAESTSKAGTLLKFLEKQFPNIPNIPKKIISLTEQEETQKIPLIIQMIEEEDIVLISEAGTPLISDPGFKLVRESIRRGIRIIPIPGPSSVTAALSISGLPTNKFTFIGFLPKSDAKRKEELTKIIKSNSTIVLFESPHRLVQTLKDIQSIFGNLEIVIARELTKAYEEIIKGIIADVIFKFEQKPPKGEFVILFSTV